MRAVDGQRHSATEMSPNRCLVNNLRAGAKSSVLFTRLFAFVSALLVVAALGDASFGIDRTDDLFASGWSRNGIIGETPRREHGGLSRGDSLVGHVERQGTFSTLTTEGTVYTSLVNGTSSAAYTYTFTPEDGKTISDYNITGTSSNQEVLTGDDLSFTQVQNEDGSYNITTTFEFARAVGTTVFSLSAVDTASGAETVSQGTSLVVGGISFYFVSTTGERNRVDSVSGPLVLSASDIASDSGITLEMFIQYLDGTNSSQSLNPSLPLSEIAISTSGVDKEVVFDSSTCSSDSGTFDGTKVNLPAGCGIGFSSNLVDGNYVGPQFGLNLEKNRNGTFSILLEWDELAIGTDLEDEGYETFLLVSIEGEVAPVVTSATPTGPFGSSGGETVSFTVDNLPTDSDVAATWDYILTVQFPDGERNATFVSATVDGAQGTNVLVFSLPGGIGENLTWTMTAVKPDNGGSITAVDGTTGGYFFTFESSVVLSGMTPNAGVEFGGQTVNLTGSFPAFDNSSADSYITIGDTTIDKSLIVSVSETEIQFVTPPQAGLTGGSENNEFAVTVVANKIPSNTLTYTFLPKSTILTISPVLADLSGGTNITITGVFPNFDPTLSTVYVNGQPVPAENIISFSDSEIVFSAPPWADVSSGDVYRVPVTVLVGDDLTNEVELVYQKEIVISSISPNSGAEEGGTTVTLEGDFVGFDTGESGVFFGGQQLDTSNVVSANDTTIVFTTPPREDIGPQYTYDITVAIGTQSSGTVTYTYQITQFTPSISAAGGQFDDATNLYILGNCANSYYGATIPGALIEQGATFSWSIADANNPTSSPISGTSIATDETILYIPYETLVETTTYTLTLTVDTEFSDPKTATLNIVRSRSQTLGVRIIDPDTISPSEPNVTLTIPADITTPSCIGTTFIVESSEIIYRWTFRGTVYEFSYLNTSVDRTTAGPTLLGREFSLPQSEMEYGEFVISLEAFYRTNEEVSGSDSATVRIVPAGLIATIGGGQARRQVSNVSDIEISGANSRDPDVTTGDPTAGLSYSWDCFYSNNSLATSGTSCDSGLLPSSSGQSFTVTSEALTTAQDTSSVFITYSLVVSKTSTDASGASIARSSSNTTATLVLSPRANLLYESLVSINVVDNSSEAIDLNNVKYYEDVVITPVAASSETEWLFGVVSPRTERQLLQSSDSLLQYAGFVGILDGFTTSSLGLAANALKPGTTYQFSITSTRVGYEPNEEVLELRTLNEPTVTVSSVSPLSGDTNSSFIASASVDYDSDFKFYFRITDEFGRTTCVDGCQGKQVVNFRIGSSGTYSVSVEVRDSRGFTALAKANYSSTITVTSANLETVALASSFETELEASYQNGDHAVFQQLGEDMVKRVLSANQSFSPEEDSATLSNFTRDFSQVVSNSVPNAVQSQGFVQTAVALATLTPDLGITYDEETLYHLVNITVNAVQNVPTTAAMDQLETLLDFYGLTPSLVLASGSAGTTRTRLAVRNEDTAPSILILDLYEVGKALISLVALKGVTCGYTTSISTGQPSLNLQGLASRAFGDTGYLTRNEAETRPCFTPAGCFTNQDQIRLTSMTFELGHICNPEQGTFLEISDQTTGRLSRFDWCEEVFQEQIRELYFVAVRSPDYVYISRVRQNTTLTDGLITVLITEVVDNELVDANPGIENCLTVTLTVPSEVAGNTSSLGLSPEQELEEQPSQCHLAPEKEWGVSEIAEELYQCAFPPDQTIAFSPRTDKPELTDASFRTTKTGIYTVATRIAWTGPYFLLEGFFVTVPEIAGVTVSIFVLILLVTVSTWMSATRYAGEGGGAGPMDMDFTYVERDVYGRGTAIDMMDAHESGM